MNPLTLLSGVWGYVGIGVIALGIGVGGTHYVDSNVYGNQIKDLKLTAANTEITNANTAFDNLARRINTINVSTADYETKSKDLNDRLDILRRDFLNAIKKSPLPPDCRPDAERVRQLDQAIDVTNSGEGYTQTGPSSGVTVRSHPETSTQ